MTRLLCALGFHNWSPISPDRLLGNQNLETLEFQVVGSIDRSQCIHCQAILNVAPKGNRWIEFPRKGSRPISCPTTTQEESND